jgi:hypothetical protein
MGGPILESQPMQMRGISLPLGMVATAKPEGWSQQSTLARSTMSTS